MRSTVYRALGIIRIFCWCAAALLFILWFSQTVIFCRLDRAAFAFGTIAVCCGGILSFQKKKGALRRLFFAFLLPGIYLGLLLLFWGGSRILSAREFQFRYPSPDGEYLLIEEVDIGGTPCYFLQQHKIFMKRLLCLKGVRLDGSGRELEWISGHVAVIHDNLQEMDYTLDLSARTVTESAWEPAEPR